MPPSSPGADFDALVDVIETLQERVARNDAVGRSETRTRTALIDPLLSALGWDTTNPEIVIQEYRVRDGRADYALLKSLGTASQPIAFIEAKRLIEDLDEHLDQVLGYSYYRDSVMHVVLTNGDRWKFYENSADGYACVLDISILHGPARRSAEYLLPFRRGPEGFAGTGEVSTPVPKLGPDLPDNGTPVEVGTIVSWFTVALAIGSIAGGVFGFRAAEPVLEELVGPLGAIVVAIVVIAGGAFLLPRLPWNRLWDSLWPGNATTLAWSSGALAGGGLIGGLLGYIVALRVAQPFFDLLAGVGTIVLLAAAAAGVGLVIWLIATSDSRKRRSTYRGRRGRRR